MSLPGEPRELAASVRPPELTWHPVEPAPARAGRVAAGMAAIAVAVTALGAPFGLLWTAVAPDVPLRVTAAGPTYADAQPEQLVAGDGWFAILGLPFGILLAAGVWLAARRVRGLPALAALSIGAVGAGLLAWWLGRHIGLAGYRETLAAADVGARLDRPPDIAAAELGWWPPRVLGVLLVPALAAAATYTLTAAWSRFPTLRPVDLQGAEPDRPAGPGAAG